MSHGRARSYQDRLPGPVRVRQMAGGGPADRYQDNPPSGMSADSRAKPEPKRGRQYSFTNHKVADCHRSPFSPPLPAIGRSDQPLSTYSLPNRGGWAAGWSVVARTA